MKGKKKIILASVFITLVIIGITAGITIYSYNTRVYRHCVFEAGVEIEPEDFLKKVDKKIVFTEDSEDIDTTILGDYPVKLKSGLFTYDCIATIQDTVPPQAEAVDVFFEEEQTVTIEEFVKNIQDITEVELSYEKEPDYSIYGKQEVEILLRDAGGNETTLKPNLIKRVTKKEVIAEVGDVFPDIREFLLSDEDATFVTNVAEIDMNNLAEHNIEIFENGIVNTTVLKIEDSVVPVVETQDVEILLSQELEPEAFILSATDKTELTYTFEQTPNWTMAGEQTVSIQVTDEGGNQVVADAVMNVIQDTKAPEITGAVDSVVYLGTKISYKKGISVTDDYDANPTLTVDNSQVNVNAVGTYPVVYTATDESGNQSSVTVTITVREKIVTLEEINQLSDSVLNTIIPEGATPYDKVQIIYDWIRQNVRYVNTSEKGNWLKSAYQGFTLHSGDCYVYASISKALLSRAGIENMDIENIPGADVHYWNLVNIGAGWYHFDTTPRQQNNMRFCYMTHTQLMDYSNNNGHTHNYDTIKYQVVQ